jgi:hypothetical protein
MQQKNPEYEVPLCFYCYKEATLICHPNQIFSKERNLCGSVQCFYTAQQILGQCWYSQVQNNNNKQ